MNEPFTTQTSTSVLSWRCWTSSSTWYPETIFIKDRDRKYVIASRFLIEYSNTTQAELIGRCSDKFIPAETMQASQASDAVVLQQGKRYQRVLTCKDKDGSDRHFEVLKLPLWEGDQIVGVIGLGQNLTQQRSAEERVREQEDLLVHASRLSTLGENGGGNCP